jgi:putative endonuclease
MSLLARAVYRALVWKERQRARVARHHAKVQTSDSGKVARSPTPDATRATHLETGSRGEGLAYWYLRQAGYTVVARNHPSGRRSGELDLIAWDGPVLVFVEVKARTSLDAGQPESAISPEKRRRVAKTAKEYMRRMDRRTLNYRFDTVSVLWDSEAGCHVRLTKDAFKIK